MTATDGVKFKGLRGQLKRNEPMSQHVSWRAGGRADRFFAPADLVDLAMFLRQLPEDEPLLFVGLGSNLMVRDGGWRGTVVLTHVSGGHPEMDSGLVRAQAGIASPKVARFAARHNLDGAEFLAGIPGTVGGALAMNAGCYGGETWDIVERVATIDRRGSLYNRGKDDFDIGYRHCTPKQSREEWYTARGSASGPATAKPPAASSRSCWRGAWPPSRCRCPTPAACSAIRRGTTRRA